jgi:hypothetical protein
MNRRWNRGLGFMAQVGEHDEGERGDDAEREIAVEHGQNPAERGGVVRIAPRGEAPDRGTGCQADEGSEVAAEIGNFQRALATGADEIVRARGDGCRREQGQAIRALAGRQKSPPMGRGKIHERFGIGKGGKDKFKKGTSAASRYKPSGHKVRESWVRFATFVSWFPRRARDKFNRNLRRFRSHHRDSKTPQIKRRYAGTAHRRS